MGLTEREDLGFIVSIRQSFTNIVHKHKNI